MEKILEEEKKIQDQSSIQQNKQDLEQQQQVDVKPNQINLQRIEVTVNTKLENYSGGINGIIYKGKADQVAANADVYLYFGVVNDFPVKKIKADENGYFFVEDLPPGFYSIKVSLNSYIGAFVYNIKVLPGQNTSQSILLNNNFQNNKRKF